MAKFSSVHPISSTAAAPHQNLIGHGQLSHTCAHLLWPYRCAHPSHILLLNYSFSKTHSVSPALRTLCYSLPLTGLNPSPLGHLSYFISLLLYILHCIPSICVYAHVYIYLSYFIFRFKSLKLHIKLIIGYLRKCVRVGGDSPVCLKQGYSTEPQREKHYSSDYFLIFPRMDHSSCVGEKVNRAYSVNIFGH